MMHLFDYDGPAYLFVRRLGDRILLHLLWLLTSLPIITIGASTTALYHVALQRAAGEDTPLAKTFFTAFRACFWRATGLWLALVAMGGLLVVNLFFWSRVAEGGFAQAMSVISTALCIPYGLLLIYAFAVQAQSGEGVRKTIGNALFTAYAHPLVTVRLAILWILVILLNCSVAYLNFVMVTFGFGFICCFCAKIMQNSLPKAVQHTT